MRLRDAQLQSRLEHLRDLYPTLPDHHYRNPHDFVLREGTVYRCLRSRPSKLLPNHCFHNAIVVATVYGMPYVEGYAQPFARAEVVAHAWNLDARGNVVDVSWSPEVDPLDRAYLGVQFSARRAHDCSWHGDACVLDDNKRDWPVLREPWQGEESPGDLDGLLEVMAADVVAEVGDSDPGIPQDVPTIVAGWRRYAEMSGAIA